MLHVHSVQWNAGMGTLHPNSCFCFFSIPTSRIKYLLLVQYASADHVSVCVCVCVCVRECVYVCKFVYACSCGLLL